MNINGSQFYWFHNSVPKPVYRKGKKSYLEGAVAKMSKLCRKVLGLVSNACCFLARWLTFRLPKKTILLNIIL